MIYAFAIIGVPQPKGNSRRVLHVKGKLVFAPDAKYLRWLKSARLQLNVAKARLGIKAPIESGVRVFARFFRDRRPDIDNLAKGLGDALQAAGVLANDRQIEEWRLSRWVPDGRPRVEVEITLLEGP